MRENGPLLSLVVDPPGTKGGPRAGNFPGPPKNPFCPGWSHDPGQKPPPHIFLPLAPFFQHLATSAPSILLAAVVPSSAPPGPKAPHRRPKSSAPPPRDPETAATSWPRPPPGGRPRLVRRHRPPRAQPGGLPRPEDRLPEHRPRGSTRCAASSSPTSASPVRRRRAQPSPGLCAATTSPPYVSTLAVGRRHPARKPNIFCELGSNFSDL